MTEIQTTQHTSEAIDDPVIVVRRQWNDWREASYRLSQISRLHWTNMSGGVNVLAPKSFVHGYVWCDQMIDGELAHSCNHGAGPHWILVCIVKKANKAAFAAVLARLQTDTTKMTT